MIVGEFVEKYIEHNSLIRLVYKKRSGHRLVLNDWNDVSMEHELLKEKGKFKDYFNNEVIGIASILVRGCYTEAINISIKEIDLITMRKHKLNKIIKDL